ncbi:helix-turn-helix transcriptional regulator [Endozoicomonas sp. SCSIO W0465]|uniref:helix-turn-helix transcriptional regulator n=1 Tax=Endozoicomonas sp. SCSIO W0465 TaxID=2918516 RepID=UPI0035321153
MARKRISERRVAALAGVSQPAVSKWCSGKSVPRLDTFYQLCLILESSPNELLGWDTQ